MLYKDIIIRPIRLEDNAAIASIIRDSLMEFGAARPGTVYFDDTTDHLFELFHNRNAAYFIAERKEIVVAGAGIFPTEGLADGDCELVKMYVSAEARGIGLGKIMLMKCMD
ncbi:MAG: GNAT family N-acetyltransferase, partial [Ginsengibacter sp.]